LEGAIELESLTKYSSKGEGMAQKRKTWREKLESPAKGLPKVVEGPPEWERRLGGRRVLVPTPLLVDGLISKIAQGKLVTVRQIRERLARNFNADSTCPLTTGIFMRIVSEVAEEDLRTGKKRVTPYWRVIGNDGSLTAKSTGGRELQAARLIKEGHTILPSETRKPPRVKDFQKYLQKL
jgi:hypothetical protein